MTLIRHALFFALTMCFCVGEEPRKTEPRSATEKELPDALETLISEMITNTTEDQKREIRQAPAAEVMVDHFGAGLALRNGVLNQKNSEVRKYMMRKGLFAPDDLSTIVLLSAVRSIRGEPIDLEGQIKGYREFWEKLDQVAPTDLECPKCKKEMDVGYWGPADPAHPDRAHFYGTCENRHAFYFYHKDGWKPESEFKSEQRSAR